VTRAAESYEFVVLKLVHNWMKVSYDDRIHVEPYAPVFIEESDAYVIRFLGGCPGFVGRVAWWRGSLRWSFCLGCECQRWVSNGDRPCRYTGPGRACEFSQYIHIWGRVDWFTIQKYTQKHNYKHRTTHQCSLMKVCNRIYLYHM
jgi:hypothetical protein